MVVAIVIAGLRECTCVAVLVDCCAEQRWRSGTYCWSLLLLCAAAEERQEGLKLVVAVCKAVSKSDVATAEGLVAGWDVVQERPELAKAATTKLVDEIENKVKKMTKAVGRTTTAASSTTTTIAPYVAPYGAPYVAAMYFC